VVQVFLLIYVAGVVPYRIGFGKDVLLGSSWFWFDLLLDIYFLTDLVLSFRTAFYSAEGDLEYEPGQVKCSCFVMQILLVSYSSIGYMFAPLPVRLLGITCEGGSLSMFCHVCR
jgi:hypothetical protein